MSAHQQCRVPVRSRVLSSHTIAARQLWLIALALLTAVVLGASRLAHAAVAISINIAPPALPVYEQPVIPAPGYVWAPGYWAYGPDGYYWVPGTWIEPPAVGLLWTPGYWGWSNGVYAWTAGYWGPVVGYYGGINYGYGYPGRGYEGGYWQGNQFYYNRTVNNISTANVTNVYSKTVVNNVTVNNVSYNGGPGGVSAKPTAQEQAAERQRREGPTAAQTQQVAAAAKEPQLRASVNHGAPPIAATPKAGSFSGAGIVHARGSSGVSGAPAERQAAAAKANDQHQAQANAQRQAEQQHQAQASAQHQAEQKRHLAEAPRSAPPPQQHEHAAPAHPAPAERMAPQHAAPQEREAPKSEPRQEQQRKPEEPGRPQSQGL
jgi:WXXGXW repeat (2 copies)